ncbi:MAG TPA: ABC transporter ATP-binding protein [Candidatus Faecousia intestinavium]|nr:ABC transporter ATP-binding protein [Candidatus Faecousia intestinavium]
MPPVRMRGDGRKAKNPKQTIARLLSYLGAYKKTLIVVVICIVLNAIAQATSSASLGLLVDNYILPMLGQTNPDFGPLVGFLLMLAGIYLVGIISAFLYNFLMVRVGQGTQKNIRDQMFTHMQTLPIRYFDTHPAGDVMSRYTSDIDTLRQMLSQSIPQCIASAATLIVVFAAMLLTSPILTLVLMVTVSAILMVTKVVAGKSAGFFIGQQTALGAVNGYVEEMINGQRVIKVFCHEKAIKEDFDELNDRLRENAFRAGAYSNAMGPINNNLGYVQYAILAVVGGLMAVYSGGSLLTLGKLISFLTLSRSFNMPISQISNQVNSVVMALAGAERIFQLMDEPSEEDHGYVELVNAKIDENGNITESAERTGRWAWKHPHKAEGTITYTELKGDITMFNVDFGYTPEKTVLHDVTLYAHPGQKIAFVGATGAGKTTITNLLNRFYDIADGKIRYDNININKIRKTDLRNSLGMVLQDTNLFTGTVMENIRYGKLDATDEECIQAAKLANAHDFITRLPKGYDTELTGNGSSLSQGQRQLLAIARAAVADPPVMILDEATSSIDTRTEKLVQDGMEALMKGRTVFVIAHRLSTIMNSDCIMVLDHGRIIERGTHDQLIAEKGTYYKLYTGVFELE